MTSAQPLLGSILVFVFFFSCLKQTLLFANDFFFLFAWKPFFVSFLS